MFLSTIATLDIVHINIIRYGNKRPIGEAVCAAVATMVAAIVSAMVAATVALIGCCNAA